MNSTEQKQHKSRLDNIEAELGKRLEAVEVVTESLDDKVAAIAAACSQEIAGNTAALTAADELLDRKLTAADSALLVMIERLDAEIHMTVFAKVSRWFKRLRG